MRTTTSKVWPYVFLGSAIGGTVGYLFMTNSGKKVRYAMTHPDEIAENLDEARVFLERKASVVTDKVQTVLDRAKQAMEAGQRAFQEAETGFQTSMRPVGRKTDEIASGVHKSVDNLSKTAGSVEQKILDPLYEAGALYKGIQRGIRTFLGKQGEVRQFKQG